VPPSSKVGVELIGDWKGFVQGLDSEAFTRRLQGELRKANELIGKRFQRQARALIRGGAYAPNSPMTIILKGSSKPLLDRGDLFQAITYEVESSYVVQVGVIKARLKGPDALDIAWILHEGATINVEQHPKVRRKLWAMLRERMAGLAKMRKPRREVTLKAAGAMGLGRKKKFTRKQVAYLIATGKINVPGRQHKPTSNAIWTIPARPFIARPLADPAFTAYALERWSAAVKVALKDP
jgi:hypothetical protein